MQLDKRLRSVVDEIRDSDTTIDVGTDHGKVILTAVVEGRAKKGIASDISKDSLAKARELADKMGVPIDTRVGDGLAVIEDGEVDTAVIAGMGGQEIVKILSNYNGKVERLILVPHRDTRLVRRYLVDNGYRIDKDYMVKEGSFFYSIIVANVGKGSITKREEFLGKNTLDNEAFREYIAYRHGVISSILAKTINGELREEMDIIEGEYHED